MLQCKVFGLGCRQNCFLFFWHSGKGEPTPLTILISSVQQDNDTNLLLLKHSSCLKAQLVCTFFLLSSLCTFYSQLLLIIMHVQYVAQNVHSLGVVLLHVTKPFESINLRASSICKTLPCSLQGCWQSVSERVDFLIPGIETFGVGVKMQT